MIESISSDNAANATTSITENVTSPMYDKHGIPDCKNGEYDVDLTQLNANMVFAQVYDPKKYSSRDIYEVKTRRILSYSNLIASASNVIWVGGNAFMGNQSAWRDLDIGGIIVTMRRLISDKKFIQSVKEEFIYEEFKKRIQGDELKLLEINE